MMLLNIGKEKNLTLARLMNIASKKTQSSIEIPTQSDPWTNPNHIKLRNLICYE
jgi:hypothetical protein